MKHLLFLIASIFGLLACGQPQTLVVEVCGDFLVPWDLDTVRVVTLDSDQRERSSGVISLVDCKRVRSVPLPVERELTAPDPPFRVRVEGFRQGSVIVSSELRVESLDGTRQRIPMRLSTECEAVTCPDGQTCEETGCALAPLYDDAWRVCDPAAPASDALGDGGEGVTDAGDVEASGDAEVGPSEPDVPAPTDASADGTDGDIIGASDTISDTERVDAFEEVFCSAPTGL